MKIFASDLDGTLFFKDYVKGYREEDMDAIKKFQSEGNLFGCCTGRALFGATPSFENILDCDFYIASSGAIICDRNLNVIDETPIPFDIVRSLIKTYLSQVTIFIQAKQYYIMQEGFPSEMFTFINDIEQLSNESIYSICLITQDHDLLGKIYKQLQTNYPTLSGYMNMDAIDIVMKGCSKGEAVKKVKAYYKAEKSYGIGDAHNDIPLLKDADVSFTFHSSHDEVKHEANQIVSSVEEAINLINQGA